mmetsp:Transcript_90045/g.291404  ORF Transcript_90045/g.291404 Transcript_90045/m.291404 type:complete len:210 (-) Transcript_90045:1144-1773(-)
MLPISCNSSSRVMTPCRACSMSCTLRRPSPSASSASKACWALCEHCSSFLDAAAARNSEKVMLPWCERSTPSATSWMLSLAAASDLPRAASISAMDTSPESSVSAARKALRKDSSSWPWMWENAATLARAHFCSLLRFANFRMRSTYSSSIKQPWHWRLSGPTSRPSNHGLFSASTAVSRASGSGLSKPASSSCASLGSMRHRILPGKA